MSIPRYKDFAKDFTAMWEAYSAIDPFEGVDPGEMTELREKWNLLKIDGDSLAEALNGKGGADEIWDQHFSYTLNQILKLDTYRNAFTEDYDAEDLTEALNTRKESAVMWRLSQLGRNIHDRIEMMRLDSEHRDNKNESALMRLEYWEIASAYPKFSDKFALYESADALEKALEDNGKALERAQNKVDEIKKEHQLDETMLEPKYVNQLRKERDQQRDESERLAQKYKDIGKDIKTQENNILKLQSNLELLKQQSKEEQAKKEKLRKEVAEDRRVLEEEAKKLYQQGDILSAAVEVKTFSGDRAAEAENFFSALRTEIAKRPSWAILSSTRDEMNYQKKRNAFLDVLERYEDSAREYNKMEETYGSFLKQKRNADFAKQLMENGERLSTLPADKREDLAPNEKYALDTYLAAEEHKKQLRKGFNALNPDKVFWKEFDEKTATFAGIMEMSDKLCTMNKAAIGEQYIQPAPGKELTEFEKRCNAGMAEIEKNYNELKAFRRQQAETQQQIGKKEKEVAEANQRLSEMQSELERKETELSNDTLDQSIVKKEKELEEANKTLEETKITQKETLASQKNAEKKVNQIEQKAANMLELKKACEDAAAIRKEQDDLEEMKSVADELYNKTCNLDQRMKTLIEYYGFTTEELSQPPKSRGDANNLKLMDSVREKLFNGLNHFSATAEVGKERGHKDTDEYKTMINALKMLTENDGAALKDKTPDEVKDLLNAVGKGAADYIHAKEQQYFQAFRHSDMRKIRLDYARELQKFCQTGVEMVERAKTDKYDMLAWCWDGTMRQHAIHPLNDGKLMDGQTKEEKDREVRNELMKNVNKTVKERLAKKKENANKESSKDIVALDDKGLNRDGVVSTANEFKK